MFITFAVRTECEVVIDAGGEVAPVRGGQNFAGHVLEIDEIDRVLRTLHRDSGESCVLGPKACYERARSKEAQVFTAM